MDTEKQRQRRCDDARLTECGNARSEHVVPTESLTTEFGLPEWIRTSKARLVLRYEISDLFCSEVTNSNCILRPEIIIASSDLATE